jgi:hypothetical protein
MKSASYLGDGVYVHLDESDRIILTTGHHEPEQADNTIVLEPEVLDALKRWLNAASLS